MSVLFWTVLDYMTAQCQLISLTTRVMGIRTAEGIDRQTSSTADSEKPLGLSGPQSRACRAVTDGVRAWRVFMSIPAPPRPAGRFPRRLLRPLSALSAAALTASMLAACSSSGASAKDTLVVVEWTNSAAVTYTQQIDSLFEKEHPGVQVTLETAPTANAGW